LSKTEERARHDVEGAAVWEDQDLDVKSENGLQSLFDDNTVQMVLRFIEDTAVPGGGVKQT
jgi:hypothetical protein